MITTNGAKGILAVVALLAGVLLVALAIHIENNPMAFTTKRTVVNVTLPVKPVEQPKLVAQAEPREITLDPVIITGDLHHAGPGAAMVKAKPKTKAKQDCSNVDECEARGCKLTYRVIGYADDKFEKFSGVFECGPR